MMTKVMFFFAGTNDTAENYAKSDAQYTAFSPNDDLIKIYIDGCQAPEVGGAGGAIYPDLNVVASNVLQAFKKEDASSGVRLSLDALQEKLGKNMVVIRQKAHHTESELPLTSAQLQGDVTVDGIVLTGFSRGGMTTLKQAATLDHLGIPISIIADQAVPGRPDFDSEYIKSVSDLSHLKHLDQYFGFYGNYHLQEEDWVHNYYFWQLIPTLPEKQKNVHHYLLPFEDHWASSHSKREKHASVLKRLFNQQEQQGESLIPPSLIQHHICRSLALCINGMAQPQLSDPIVDFYDKNKTAYAYVAESVAQPIHGQEQVDVKKDPHYMLALRKHVELYLKTHDFTHGALTDKQIYTLWNLAFCFDDVSRLRSMIDFILTAKSSAQKDVFMNVVNDVTEHGHFLCSKQYEYKKDIDMAVEDYKQSIFEKTFKLVKLEHPTINDIRTFKKHVRVAEARLRVSVADYPIIHQCLQAMRKTILRAIFSLLGVDSSHQKQQGRLFSIRPTQVVEALSEKIFDNSAKPLGS
jgi:hypothetical protein